MYIFTRLLLISIYMYSFFSICILAYAILSVVHLPRILFSFSLHSKTSSYITYILHGQSYKLYHSCVGDREGLFKEKETSFTLNVRPTKRNRKIVHSVRFARVLCASDSGYFELEASDRRLRWNVSYHPEVERFLPRFSHLHGISETEEERPIVPTCLFASLRPPT